MSTLTTYLGYDNLTTVVPYADVDAGTNYDMTDVTEVRAKVDVSGSTIAEDALEMSSLDTPVTITWDNASGDWQIYLAIGRFPGLTAGKFKLRVIVVEPLYPNGLVIADAIKLTVVDKP